MTNLKHCVSMIILLFSNFHVYPTDIVNELKSFREKADMDCFMSKIETHINQYFVEYNRGWGLDRYNIVPQKINLQKEKYLPMLTIQFVDTERYNYNQDIYDYISIDSTIVFTLACVDKKMNVSAFANYFDGVNGYIELNDLRYKTKKRVRLKSIIKNISKQEPEMILYCNSLAGFHDDNGFLFIKNNKIYVYRVVERDIYELNYYLKKFFSLERIRSLKKNNSLEHKFLECWDHPPLRQDNTPN